MKWVESASARLFRRQWSERRRTPVLSSLGCRLGTASEEIHKGSISGSTKFAAMRAWILALLLLSFFPGFNSLGIFNHLASSSNLSTCCCAPEICCCSDLPTRQCQCVMPISRSEGVSLVSEIKTKTTSVLKVEMAQEALAPRGRSLACSQIRFCFRLAPGSLEAPLPQRLGLHHFDLPPPGSCV